MRWVILDEQVADKLRNAALSCVQVQDEIYDTLGMYEGVAKDLGAEVVAVDPDGADDPDASLVWVLALPEGSLLVAAAAVDEPDEYVICDLGELADFCDTMRAFFAKRWKVTSNAEVEWRGLFDAVLAARDAVLAERKAQAQEGR